jgi:two-component system cell cycle response regulator
MSDIDHFKNVNDTHGHPAGDAVLRQFAERLRVNVREADILGRYGGEEFIIILPHTDVEESYRIAERLRLIIVEKFQSDNLTVSMGVSNCPKSGKTIESLIKKADDSLYKSKSMGKNRVS